MAELTRTSTSERRPETPPAEPRVGLTEGNASAWKFASTVALTQLNRWLDRIPLSRWFHRRVLARMVESELEVDVAGLPSELDGFRIAFASDLHVGSYLHERELTAFFARINDWAPDLICLGGDLINSRLEELAAYPRALSELSPPHGVFAVPGNHDIFFVKDRADWNEELDRLGVEVLTNRGVRIESDSGSFWLAGVDDLEEGRPHLERALDGRRNDEPVVLLSHHPDFFPVASAAGVDLQLSGHTHGGQICLFGRALVSHSQEGFVSGWFQRENSRLYVSRGVGTTCVPVRVGCDPETVFVTMRTSPRVCARSYSSSTLGVPE